MSSVPISGFCSSVVMRNSADSTRTVHSQSCPVLLKRRDGVLGTIGVFGWLRAGNQQRTNSAMNPLREKNLYLGKNDLSVC